MTDDEFLDWCATQEMLGHRDARRLVELSFDAVNAWARLDLKPERISGYSLGRSAGDLLRGEFYVHLPDFVRDIKQCMIETAKHRLLS